MAKSTTAKRTVGGTFLLVLGMFAIAFCICAVGVYASEAVTGEYQAAHVEATAPDVPGTATGNAATGQAVSGTEGGNLSGNAEDKDAADDSTAKINVAFDIATTAYVQVEGQTVGTTLAVAEGEPFSFVVGTSTGYLIDEVTANGELLEFVGESNTATNATYSVPSTLVAQGLTIKVTTAEEPEGAQKENEPMLIGMGEDVVLTISGESSMYVGTSQTLALTGGATGNVSWSSSDETVATVDSAGTVVAQKVSSESQATITAVAANGSATFEITVKPKPGYTVTYNVNGGFGFAPESYTGEAGEVITLPDNSSVKVGKTFVGWSAYKDATGRGNYTQTVYPAGSEYTIPQSNVTLYATWADSSLSAKFFIRLDGTIAYEPQSHPTSEYTKGITVDGAIAVGKFTNLVTEGDSNLLKVPTDEQIKSVYKNYNPDTQYVQWYAIKNEDDGWHVDGALLEKSKVQLVYDANCGEVWVSGTMPDGATYTKGTTTSVSSLTPQRTDGYVFTGWNTAADGSGVSYQPSSSITLNQNTTLYAQWENKNTYTVTYVAESGGSIASGAATSNPNLSDMSTEGVTGSVAVPDAGYTFVGWYSWNTSVNGGLVSAAETLSAADAIANLHPGAGAVNYADTTYTAKFTASTNTAYTVQHYLLSADGTQATLAESESLTGTTGTTVWASPKSYEGYTCQMAYDSNGFKTVVTGTIAGDGSLVLKLYYAPNSDITGTVRYLLEGTETELADSVEREGLTFGTEWSEDALEIEGYTLVSDSTQTVTVAAQDNTITFWYAEVPAVEPEPETPDNPEEPTTPATEPTPGVTPGDGPVDAFIDVLATPFAAPAGEGTSEVAIDEDGNPLSGADIDCWVHHYIVIGIVITVVYAGGVLVRRKRFESALAAREDEVLRGDE